MKPTYLLSALLASSFVSLSSLAADEAPNYAEDTLTGDWGGTRSALSQKGLALDIGYKADLLRNTDGGIKKGGRPMTHLDFKLAADLDKLAGWSGGSGYFNFIHDGGDKFNADRVGSWTGVSNIEVGTNTYRFLHAWLQQEFADGRGAVLAGLYPIDSEFQVVDTAGIFLQPPYGASADIALTRGPSIFNNSAFGIRGKWSFADRAAYVQGAVLDGIPGDPAKPRGTHIKFAKGDGSMWIAEIGLKPGDAQPAESGAAEKAEAKEERVEKYAAGVWRYTATVADQVDTNNRLSWGWYALAEKTLLDNVAGFVRISGTDGDSTAVRRAVNIGVQVKSPLPGREDDAFGLAHTRATLSSKWRESQALLLLDTTAFEDAWEATYRIQACKWLVVQPVLQYIRHPGGLATSKSATIVGARIEIAL